MQRCLPNRKSTVGADAATSHVAGVLAEQEHTRGTLLMGLTEATHRHSRGLVVTDGFVHDTRLLRVAETRLEGVHTNVVFGLSLIHI